jgi:CysZ protein
MLPAVFLALNDAFEPRLRRAVLLGVLAAAAVFAALWAGVGSALAHTRFFEIGWLDTALAWLGTFATMALSFLLFPAVATGILATFFLDGVVDAVEARHYPRLPAPRPQPFAETAAGALRLMGTAALLNLLLLPLHFILPGFSFIILYAANGYLLGREYFELVALRRFDKAAVRALRRRHAAWIVACGVVIAVAFSVPLLNLAAPVLGAAFMAHAVHRGWRVPEN